MVKIVTHHVRICYYSGEIAKRLVQMVGFMDPTYYNDSLNISTILIYTIQTT